MAQDKQEVEPDKLEVELDKPEVELETGCTTRKLEVKLETRSRTRGP